MNSLWSLLLLGSLSLPPVATFSIVAIDPANGDLGVTVASRYFSVGSVVPWAEAGVGAVATQANVNVGYGPRALELLKQGLTAQQVLDRLREEDKFEGKDGRQIAIIDAKGRIAAYTGPAAQKWAGDKQGPAWSAQGNILAGPQVVEAMGRAFEATQGELAEKLYAALKAGDEAGGDSRGKQSASLLVVRKQGGRNINNDRYIYLNVDDSPEPFTELRRLLDINLRLLQMDRAYKLKRQEATQESTKGTKDTKNTKEERIARVEAGIPAIEVPGQPPLQPSLAEWMRLLKVPGLSVAVFDNFRIVWSKAYGVREAGGSQPVTLGTLFQAGSISKPVTAAATMSYVQRGKLSLDENVNNKLATWKVPDNEFTSKEKVTLRRIMSHSAGLTVHGFPGYAVNEPRPTTRQIFNGEKPANTAPIRVDLVPGTKHRYSGGGTTVMQQLLVDAFHQPFPQLMRETVLRKIGMNDSTYEQPLPPERAVLAATGHRSNGEIVTGKWHVYPEMAAAGLWTTPIDLAKFAIEIAQAWNGKSKLLSAATARQMLAPQIEEVALGFFTGKDNPRQFGHNGADEGFQALLIAFADTGQGVAIMANSDNGIRLMNLLAASIAREYRWKYRPFEPSGGEVILALIAARGVDAAVAQYRELRRSRPNAGGFQESHLNFLGYEWMRANRLQDAIKIFELNVEMFPAAWNPWDSLAEAYMNLGNKDLAIKYYEKSLQLNPKNDNAVKMLEKIRR